jgi:hypothetical protein
MKFPSYACPSPSLARDSHDVAVIFITQIFVFVNKSLPHPRGMFLIHPEENVFLEAVPTFLQEVGDFLGNELGAVRKPSSMPCLSE